MALFEKGNRDGRFSGGMSFRSLESRLQPEGIHVSEGKRDRVGRFSECFSRGTVRRRFCDVGIARAACGRRVADLPPFPLRAVCRHLSFCLAFFRGDGLAEKKMKTVKNQLDLRGRGTAKPIGI